MNENRQSPRARLDVLVNTFVDGLPTLCIAEDISEGGLGFRRIHSFRDTAASVVDVEFLLPESDEVILARGHYRHESERPGIAFDWIDQSHADLIRDYVGDRV